MRGRSSYYLNSFVLSLYLLLSIRTSTGASENDNAAADIVSQIQSGQVHPLWLRERCQESFYADPNTRQPRYNLHEEVGDLKVLQVKQSSGAETILVTFSDKQSCAFSSATLRAELDNEVTFMQTSTWSLPPKFLWDAASLIAPSAFTHDEVLEDPFQTKKFLSSLLTTGIALIEGVPQQAGECVNFGQSFSTLRETEWGREFNVRSVPDETKQDLAYSSHSIGMHSDNVYRIEEPPAFQLLHAIEHCDTSKGEPCHVHNKMVDSFAVAQTLCENNRDYFDILTRVQLRWENNGGDDSSFLYRYAPMIELEDKHASTTSSTDDQSCPAVKAINFSAKSGGYAPNLPSEQLELFYAAKREFSSILHNDEYAIQVQLFPGALLIFDNRRVLHSRSGISPTDGARWLQGCYFNRDGFSFKYEQIRRKLSNATETPFYSLFSATRADHDRMGVEYNAHVIEKTKENLLRILDGQKDYYLGQPVSLKEHNIQTASRAYRGGEDDETIFISLFHDVFENLAVKNHGDLIAAMVAPWTSPKNQWMLAHHEIFQGYYYFHHYEAEGMNRTLRDMYIDDPYYNWTATWCEKYDQPSFDPDYPSLPLSVLLPSVDRVLAKPQYWWNPNHPKAGAVSNVAPKSSTEDK